MRIHTNIQSHELTVASGFEFDLRRVDKAELEQAILAANVDSKVNGIIVYYPIFNNRQDQYIQQLVALEKDIEGLSHKYVFNMVSTSGREYVSSSLTSISTRTFASWTRLPISRNQFFRVRHWRW